MASPPSNSLPKAPLPAITISTSSIYQYRLADISSRATFQDALNTLFQSEILGPQTPILASSLYTTTLSRISQKVSLGSQIVEADSFAAVACWEPPGAVHPKHTASQLAEIAKTRPVYADFIRDIEDARSECLGEFENRCWQLSLMARDPERRSKGAVRAILEPFLERARREGTPVWCVAGNERARDVYQYFGFRVVRVVRSGQGEGVRTWCMVFNWPVKSLE
ncbi:hypothetical protein VTL71DRAFT_6398 [Oculimacula yallundae]|uniref:N-acetyltransferase domain-containing protein n=1 Tax=Oculimacula yallundae TaxID=86028 RepID=A0ABR4BXR9_9HELO